MALVDQVERGLPPDAVGGSRDEDGGHVPCLC
jgi:hypothetical protein